MASVLLVAGCSSPLDKLQGPYAPAREGKVQCYDPDMARKTCSMISRLQMADGKLESRTAALAAEDSAITMEMALPVKMKDNKLCSRFTPDALETRFKISDQDATPAQSEVLRQQALKRLAILSDREMCTEYLFQGPVLRATSFIDGVENPALTQSFIWVSPDDGYVLASLTGR